MYHLGLIMVLIFAFIFYASAILGLDSEVYLKSWYKKVIEAENLKNSTIKIIQKKLKDIDDQDFWLYAEINWFDQKSSSDFENAYVDVRNKMTNYNSALDNNQIVDKDTENILESIRRRGLELKDVLKKKFTERQTTIDKYRAKAKELLEKLSRAFDKLKRCYDDIETLLANENLNYGTQNFHDRIQKYEKCIEEQRDDIQDIEKDDVASLNDDVEILWEKPALRSYYQKVLEGYQNWIKNKLPKET